MKQTCYTFQKKDKNIVLTLPFYMDQYALIPSYYIEATTKH